MKVYERINHLSQFPGDMDEKDIPEPAKPNTKETANKDEPTKKPLTVTR